MTPETVRSSAELIISVILGSVFGGAVIRFLVNKWLKDREEFERVTATRLEGFKEYVDLGLKSVREEGSEARGVLRDHVDHEDKILRDRWHSLDTLTQVLVNNLGLMRADLLKLMEAQRENTTALHELDKTISGLGKSA